MLEKLCFLMSSCFAEPRYHLSICMIFRDEAPYLKEWIEFHRLLGVEHFYLCSHNSQDNYREVLTPYLTKGIAELKELVTVGNETQEGFNSIQLNFYNEILKKSKKESKWVAFIDSDEFLFPTQANTLVEFLKDFKEFSGIAVNWQMFGTAGIQQLRPDQLLIQELVCCGDSNLLQENFHIKSIVQPKRVKRFKTNPHHPIYRCLFKQVNTDKVPFIGPFSPYIQVDQLRINHYWTRDEHYWRHYKIPRRNAWVGWSAKVLQEILDKYNHQRDDAIQRFVPALRKKMGLQEV